jgi:hypothetical protein
MTTLNMAEFRAFIWLVPKNEPVGTNAERGFSLKLKTCIQSKRHMGAVDQTSFEVSQLTQVMHDKRGSAQQGTLLIYKSNSEKPC